MIYTELRSEGVPAADRWDWWCELAYQNVGRIALHREKDTEIQSGGRRLNLSGVHVTRMNYPSVRGYRSAKLIRQFDPEEIHLALNLRGRTGIAVDGHDEAVIRAGEFTLYDTSRPTHSWLSEDDDAPTHLLVQVPRALIPLLPDKTDRLLAQPLPGDEGIGVLLSNYLTRLVTNAHQYKPADAARLSTITVDLVTAMFAHHLDATASTPHETQQRVLQIRIRDFIQQHLSDPRLSPTMIAAAHGISTRYLHKLFRDQDVTVARLIRQRRLERCRRDLADPHLHSRSVQAIASRWGFTDAAHFSRLFRAAYDVPPGDYRRIVSESNGVHGSSSTVHSQSMTS